MHDYYEILQVHPKADQDAIAAAYDRLIKRYDPARLDGAAEELVALARTRRDEIERAYAVLSDQTRRATYDAEQRAVPADSLPLPTATAELAASSALDYRPLPPARAKERPRTFDPQPVLAPQRGGRRTRPESPPQPPWFWPTVVTSAMVTVVALVTLLATALSAPTNDARTSAQPAAAATVEAALAQPTIAVTPSLEQIVNQFEGLIPPLKQATERSASDPQAWIDLGNMLYNSAQVVRENMPNSDLYKQRLPRWLEASQAYAKALALQPNNVGVRADMAVSLCNYGAGTSDQSYVQRGLQEAQRATGQSPQDARALLNEGVCLVSAQPPQTAPALEKWRSVAGMAGADPGLATEAQRLIRLYGN